jgi:hypothetical protein
MTATFDTHQFIRKLEAAGFPTSQAESLSEAFKEAQGASDWVTRKDLKIESAIIKADFQKEFAPIKSDFLLLKWMMGLILGGLIALVLRSFFPTS